MKTTLANWNGLSAWQCAHRPIAQGEAERVTVQRMPTGWRFVAKIPHVAQPFESRIVPTRDDLYTLLNTRYETYAQDWQGVAA